MKEKIALKIGWRKQGETASFVQENSLLSWRQWTISHIYHCTDKKAWNRFRIVSSSTTYFSTTIHVYFLKTQEMALW